MNCSRLTLTAISLVTVGMLLTGCSSSSTEPATNLVSPLVTESVIAQDLTQLRAGGVIRAELDGIFSIGWNQFVGPNIADAGTIGKAFAVVGSDTTPAFRGRGGIDIGSVTLVYNGASTGLTKQTTRSGGVLYSTFPKGLRDPETVPVNIPFIGGAEYSFSVSGSSGFRAGVFSVTAPPSLLDITSHADHDTISLAEDLTIAWTGGSPIDSVIVRVVPHLRREQMGHREGQMGPGQPRRHHGPGPQGPMFGPEFENRIVIVVANTGSFTVSAADMQALLAGTEAEEMMVGVAQNISQQVSHDGKEVAVLLRNGDRLVLQLR